METITERIRKLIDEECSGNRSTFARRINVTPSYVAKIYIGKQEPSDRTIADICREFNVSEDWLRSGIGEPRSESTHLQELNRAFEDILATAPDERSAFILALKSLPMEFWKLLPDLIRAYNAEIQKMESEKPQQFSVAARSGDRAEVLEVSAREEEEALSPPDSRDI